MKYRIVKRARGWVVQKFHPAILTGTGPRLHFWGDLRCHRFRFLAALHLLWLRERARK